MPGLLEAPAFFNLTARALGFPADPHPCPASVRFGLTYRTRRPRLPRATHPPACGKPSGRLPPEAEGSGHVEDAMEVLPFEDLLLDSMNADVLVARAILLMVSAEAGRLKDVGEAPTMVGDIEEQRNRALQSPLGMRFCGCLRVNVPANAYQAESAFRLRRAFPESSDEQDTCRYQGNIPSRHLALKLPAVPFACLQLGAILVQCDQPMMP